MSDPQHNFERFFKQSFAPGNEIKFEIYGEFERKINFLIEV